MTMREQPQPGHQAGDQDPAHAVHAWPGLASKICETLGGRVRPPAPSNHCVVMHVGPPTSTSCRLGDLVQQRISAPGDVDIVPGDCEAFWDQAGPAKMLGIGLTPALLRGVAQEMGLDPDRVSLRPELQVRDHAIEHIAWAMRAEVESAQPLGGLYAESLGTALAVLLLQRHARAGQERPGASYSKRRLRDVIEYIRGNLAADLSLAELAAIAGLGTSHFKSLFKDATHLPVHQYVIRCRVDEAVRLLSNGVASLSEVASIVGFSDQSHMARCMRRVLGVTPAQIRRRSI
ncbi:MAG: helix-turn-helix transcriptional regulator [Candidatus Eremiobacteraeota bacterium]|nr:helix-turn-helix transcriptional regulator [Candidatus Eremiobacteraeota bacterium]